MNSQFIISDLKKARKQLDRLECAQSEAEAAMWLAQWRIERLEAVLKRIAKTATHQKDGGIVVKCFSGDEFKIKEYVKLVIQKG